MKKIQLRQRQIHLDFHTGPWIPDVGADFDAREFARTMKQAHVNSVTVFAKCHHGHLYFPTSHPARHPNLKKGLDLTGQQVEALHREGIRAPIYISVQCDEFAADTHPEWIARNADGTNVGAPPFGAGWQILDMSSPYQDYLHEQTEEILKRYKPVDGIFFDMCWNQPSASNWAVERMLQRGLNPEKEADRARYAADLVVEYMKRYSALVKRYAPQGTCYFNSRPHSSLPSDVKYLSHVEIEALATGGWGYLYFPKNVRYARNFGKPYMGMTARFHKSWADFGGLKPFPALQYEVTQMIAHGAECSIGDQLHPRGILDKASYELIGRVYGYTEACEPWTAGAAPVTDIAVIRTGAQVFFEEPGSSNDGATRMLMHLKQQFNLLDADMDFSSYKVVILPDSVNVDAKLATKLRAFLRKGGSLILSGTSGLDSNLKPVLPEMGVETHGESPFQTTYLRIPDKMIPGVTGSDYVMYERGVRMTATKGADALCKVTEPYFDRNYLHFSSHFQTPPTPKASRYAVAIRKGRVITISYPIFKAFGTHGNVIYRQLVEHCLNQLLANPVIRVKAPSTTEVSLMRQKNRLVVHFLQFVAEHRGAMDIIEDIVPLLDVPVSLRMEKPPRRVYVAPSGQALNFTYVNGRMETVVPRIEGHQMLVVE